MCVLLLRRQRKKEAKAKEKLEDQIEKREEAVLDREYRIRSVGLGVKPKDVSFDTVNGKPLSDTNTSGVQKGKSRRAEKKEKEMALQQLKQMKSRNITVAQGSSAAHMKGASGKSSAAFFKAVEKTALQGIGKV
jgi:hypothetical protein